MSETATIWMEVGFDVAYLIAIWTLVVVMIRRFGQVSKTDQPVAKWVLIAFGLLALGDTGHVGMRVVAYAMGNIGLTASLFGTRFLLVGVGSFATAFTLTFFYVLMVFAWQERFGRELGWFEWLLIACAAVRLIILVLPQNEWNSLETPYAWSITRNIPLVIQGLGVAYLILRDAFKFNDNTFIWIGAMILVSYACYAPVILFVSQIPLLGMLMMPKTLAYLAVAFIAFFALYPRTSNA
jgi:hypothetical protein